MRRLYRRNVRICNMVLLLVFGMGMLTACGESMEIEDFATNDGYELEGTPAAGKADGNQSEESAGTGISKDMIKNELTYQTKTDSQT